MWCKSSPAHIELARIHKQTKLQIAGCNLIIAATVFLSDVARFMLRYFSDGGRHDRKHADLFDQASASSHDFCCRVHNFVGDRQRSGLIVLEIGVAALLIGAIVVTYAVMLRMDGPVATRGPKT